MQHSSNAEGLERLMSWLNATDFARVVLTTQGTNMDFFNSLTLDLKMLVVAIGGCVLLALFADNHKSEKRYLMVFAVLAAVGVYRFTQVAGADPEPRSATTRVAPQATAVAPKKTPLVSTSAK